MTDIIEEQTIPNPDEERYIEIDGKKGIFTLSEVILLLQNAGLKVRIVMHNGRKNSTVVHNAGGG